MSDKVLIKVYGRDQICASCVGAPGSKDTYEWLQAAIGRKYGMGNFNYQYVDMDHKQQNEKDQQMIEQMEDEEWLFPLILLNNEIVAEGVPQIKRIFKVIDEISIDKV